MEISEEERARIKDKVDKLKQSKFKQQQLPAWRPVPSFGSTMIIFAIFGLAFLALGIALYVMSDKIQEVASSQYNKGCDGQTESCTLEFVVTEEIEKPIYVYYQLDNFYQNHRRYVKSRSYQQLMGQDLDYDSIKDDCNPIVQNKDISAELYSVAEREAKAEAIAKGEEYTMTPLSGDAVANPCGLVAKSFFTDTFELCEKNPGITYTDPSTENVPADADYE